MSRLRREGYRVTMKDIFAHPTIESLSLCVERVEEEQDQSTVKGEVPLSPIQRHFFAHYGSHEDHHHYNQSVLLFKASGFERALLKAMLEKLHAHHDALRMQYELVDGAIVQRNVGLDYPVFLEEHDLRGITGALQVMSEKIEAYQGSIDLTSGPLMKAVLFHLDDGDRLFLTVHHLVIDGVSWRILFEDLDLMFEQYDRGEALSLPLKSSSYQSWSSKLEAYSQSNDFAKELSYWSDMDKLSIASLPKDKASDLGSLSDYSREVLTLDKDLTGLLLSGAHEAYGTDINDLLLTGLALSISEVFSVEEFLLTLEGHGREEFLPGQDISRTVGWFTSMYPVHLSLTGSKDVPGYIKGIKEQLRNIPGKGIGYGVYKYLREGNEGELSKPEIIFNYLGQFTQDIQGDYFELAKESSGLAQSLRLPGEHALDITAIIESDELKIVVSYSQNLYHSQTIRKQLSSYENHLRSIVEVCLGVSTREYTPSD
ncbi:condensation domain-containing protein, partial [Fulvivirga kasyanovii]